MSVTDFIPYNSKNAAFVEKLNPTSRYRSSGATIPELRKLAKKINKEDIEIVFLEDILLLAIVVAEEHKPFDEKKLDFDILTNYLVSWSVTDTFASSLEYDKKEKSLYYEYFLSLCDREEEMSVRLGLVTLKSRFFDEENIEEILSKITQIKTDHYLLNMGAAWTLSEAIIKYPEKALLSYEKYSDEIRRLTRKKCLESLRVKGEFRKKIELLS